MKYSSPQMWGKTSKTGFQSTASPHLQADLKTSAPLLTQTLSDNNLDVALAWLCDSAQAQEHSNVQDYSRDWATHKVHLQARIQAGEFQFQTVHEVEILSNGKSEIHELRCAEDRLLIRAIAQVLQPVFAEHIAPKCIHLAGGTQQAVEAFHAQIKAKALEMKLDIKSYYAHLDHFILRSQFSTLLVQETELQRLLWQFMQRTVERDGHYRNIKQGVPLETALSPLFGALYFSPLHHLFRSEDEINAETGRRIFIHFQGVKTGA
ncbi:reverse transcriptase family protein [Candidatus Venteria ishoeyi]|uniref:Uncharacterized protein n=1 Tax=Candidatus Venteria ishoeyi TaxID=1899563 RepID=A0A1H6FG90_9GAMM|nr:hypothetical protein [Candidatus Venteria ishoeyi]MDM8546858.1 hypothetical protein [Candidatus Venteria ishoeyi]SEH08673.1 Uncharacterised protein [Candidatus Venteria ishoeyi]